MRVAVLCSQRAPGLLYLLNRAADRGVTFEIVGVISSEPTFAEEAGVKRRGVPTIGHPIRGFPGSRSEYDAETVRLLEAWMPDVILLDGYLYLLTEPMLRAYRSRIINLHFSDLTLRHADGSPRFPGIRAVRSAVAAGISETRATVHLVDEEPDAGPPLVLSWPFPVSPLVAEMRAADAIDVFKAYTFAHQQWMLRTVSGPLIAAALRLIATSSVDLAGLGRTNAAACTPWQLDRDGYLLAPDDLPAAVAR